MSVALDANPRTDPPLDFPDREFGELSHQDYAELGFLCGLEVHQQLLTDRKLFCRCPAGIRSQQVDAEVLRHMRPTLSELGEYDGCALMEYKTRKEIIYQLARSSVCTYEMDDTPPFPIDEQAVQVAISIARLFGLDLVSELHVMRKQYLDGSIPTGFQRTAMIGGGGTIPFRASELGSDRMLRIRQLTLEEDSCREVSDVGHRITFRTDRLGMPLIETVTEPDLLTPLDAARGNRLLAAIARSSGKVRRGPGAARQDVNVSIAGSRRVEIKGVPSWRWIPRLTHNEAFRHLNLLRLRRELLARSVNAAHLAISAKGLPWECSDLVVEASSIVRRSSFGPIWDAISRGDTICAVKLPGFGGLLEHPTQPGVTFAHEIEERVRVIACPTTRPFMIGRADYGVDAATWRAVRSALRAGEGDAVVLLWGAPEDAATAAREVLLRAQDSLVGVPSETRQASAGGNTGFERILPGPERMYPDTDTPPLPIVDAWVDTIDVVERPWERADRYVAAGVPAAAAEELATSPWAELFDDLSPSAPSTARRLAFAIIKRGHGLRARLGAETASAAERLRPLVEATDAGRISPHWFEAAFYELLVDSGPAEHILDRWRPSSDDCQQQEMDVVRANVAKLSGKSADARLRWAMGQVLSTVTMDPLQLRDRLVRELALTEDGA